MKKTHLQLLTAVPRGVAIALEIFALVAVIFAGVVTYGLFRLSQAPLDLEFMRPYIEATLSGRGSAVAVQFDRAELYWPDLSGPLELQLKNLHVAQNGQDVIEVRDLSLALAKAPLLIGHLRPEKLILRAPVLSFERDVDNKLRLALIEPGTNRSDNEQKLTTQTLLGVLFGNQRGDYGIFSRVNEVAIERAQIRVNDDTQGMTWRLRDVDLAFRAVDIGVYGSVDVQLPRGQQFSLVMTYHRERDDLTITSQFRDFSLPTFAGRLLGIDILRHQRLPLTGSFELRGHIREFSLDELKLNASAARGRLATQDLVGADFPVTGLRLALNYEREAAIIRLNDFAFNLANIPVRAQGEMRRDEDGDYKGALDLRIDQLPLATVAEIWPPEYREVPIGRWLTRKLSNGVVSKLEVRVPLWAGRKERQLTMLALRPSVAFAYDHLNANYHAPLYPIEDAAGSGTYDRDILALNITRGKIKDLEVKNSTVVIRDLAKKGAGEAELRLNLQGPVQTVLRYIALDPINLGDKLHTDVDDVKGSGTYHADIAFPTVEDLPADQVEVDVDAKLNDLLMPGLVKGQSLSGGPYDLSVRDGVINMKGRGELASRPITLDFIQPVHAKGRDILMKAVAHIDSDASLRKAFGADLSFLQGSVVGDVTYTEHADGHEDVAIKADLTPTRVVFDALRYEKAAGLSASASLELRVEKGEPISASDLSVTAPKLKVQNGTLKFGKIGNEINLTEANLPNFSLNETQGRVTYRRQIGKMSINLQGNKLDLSPFMKGKDDERTVGPVLTFGAQVEKLQLGGSQDLQNADLSVTLNERSDLEQLQLIGTAGVGATTIRYLPDPQGRMTLDLQARDAGAFLRVMDIYPNMVGGDLSIKGSPIGNNNRDVKGDLVIKDFAVVKAPILAQLLGSMSPQGVNEQLANKGLGFDRLESGFAWLRRPNLDLMSFREGRTSGSALGLTFDGLYDRRKETIEISGTIIPMSGLNTFASNIPLLGQILTGGKGNALFAATYAIKGAASDPRTMINPLSVLTPGILRRIFFENSPDDPLANSERPRTPAPRNSSKNRQ